MSNNWKTYKIGKVCSRIYSGGTPSTKVKDYWGGEIPWLSSGETRKRYISSSDKTITRKGLEESSARIAYKGSVVIASAGQGKTRGQTSFLNLDTTINQSVICIEPLKKLIDERFLFFNLSNRYDEFRKISDAFSIRGSLTIDLLKTQIKIMLPPLQEQKSIASILSALDDKIELNLQMNKTLEEMAMALYKHWFVDFGPFQDGEFVDSELGMIPKEWEVKSIGDFTKILNSNRVPLSTRERSTRKGPYPYYGASGIIDSIDDFKFDGEYVMVSEDGENLRSRKTPIAFRAVGQFWVNNHAHILQGIKEGVNELVICHFAQLDMTPYLTGAVQPKLNKHNLLLVKMPMPIDDTFDLGVFDEFHAISRLSISNRAENQTLTKLRDTMLPKLISGEIRVKDVEKTIAEAL